MSVIAVAPYAFSIAAEPASTPPRSNERRRLRRAFLTPCGLWAASLDSAIERFPRLAPSQHASTQQQAGDRADLRAAAVAGCGSYEVGDSEPQAKRCERPEDRARRADFREHSEWPRVQQSDLDDECDASERAGAAGRAVQGCLWGPVASVGKAPVTADLFHSEFLPRSTFERP
jgi:hypothetical protein